MIHGLYMLYILYRLSNWISSPIVFQLGCKCLQKASGSSGHLELYRVLVTLFPWKVGDMLFWIYIYIWLVNSTQSSQNSGCSHPWPWWGHGVLFGMPGPGETFMATQWLWSTRLTILGPQWVNFKCIIIHNIGKSMHTYKLYRDYIYIHYIYIHTLFTIYSVYIYNYSTYIYSIYIFLLFNIYIYYIYSVYI